MTYIFYSDDNDNVDGDNDNNDNEVMSTFIGITNDNIDAIVQQTLQASSSKGNL